MKAELRKVKIARSLSEETTAFTADLWVDGKHIGYVKNDGQGGANFIDHRYDGKGLDTRDDVTAFEAWCEALPHSWCHHRASECADTYISDLLDQFQWDRQLKRLCKGKAVIVLQGDPDGTVRTYNNPYTPEFAAYIRANEPKLAEIVNERFL